MGTYADRAQVVAAFALPVLLVAVAGWFAWNETWNRAESELSRTADGASELSERVFSSAILAARLTNNILTGVSDQELRQDEALYNEQVATIMAEVSGSNMISVSDRNGILTLMSGKYPAPRVSVADREWVQALQGSDPPPVYVGAQSVGRVAGYPFFSVSIPRRGSGDDVVPGTYEGNINVSLDPLEIAAELRTTTQEDDDVLSLVRADGAILASTRGTGNPAPRVPSTSPLLKMIGQGAKRGIYEGESIGLRDGIPLGRGILIAFTQVGNLPVYATVSRTPAVIIAPWLQTMTALLAVGLPTSLALGFLSLTSLRRRDALGKSEAELRAAFESAATGTALLDSGTNRILKVNKRLCAMAGRDARELIGMPLDRLLQAPAKGSGRPAEIGSETTTGLSQLECPDGSIRWIELGTAPVVSQRIQDPSLVIATFHDVTERKESEERQILLAREVDHRAKNALAIVQALVRMERDPPIASYVKRVEGRIHALARSHELLAKDGWQGAALEDLLDDELSVYRDGAQVTVEGPPVVVTSDAVQPLSIVLHELATNAVKHGALATPAGILSVSWRHDIQTGELELCWDEKRGTRPGASVAAGGSGIAIIRGSVEQLGGRITLDVQDTGLTCRLTLPHTAITTGRSPVPVNTNSAPANTADTGADDLSGMRVLLAEDEYIVAMDMQELLERAGCVVIGPAANLKEAERLAKTERGALDAALLDVNLNGAKSIDLARDLARAGVGIVLITGYSEVLETDGHENWAQLRKPANEVEIVEALRRVGATSRRGREVEAEG
ncbi:HWE histidine kinase domain-containing protein [Jannaschia formosa]|uniref:HWE histidine kinase domain-containing protein n=1 Tax=Jannaschia formosa TaxID=2259592 RepID=UPI000E1C3B6D|nr:HWE histidine kinase domain-containing protein [Jannaschia formosa]TFL16090.1 PAS domain S-box protein [Jannaschia formosa]